MVTVLQQAPPAARDTRTFAEWQAIFPGIQPRPEYRRRTYRVRVSYTHPQYGQVFGDFETTAYGVPPEELTNGTSSNGETAHRCWVNVWNWVLREGPTIDFEIVSSGWVD